MLGIEITVVMEMVQKTLFLFLPCAGFAKSTASTRPTLPHELRLVITELDLEVENTLPAALGIGFHQAQMDSWGLP